MTRALVRHGAVGGLAAVLLVGGCGTKDAESQNAAVVAVEFARAAHADPTLACDLLTPETAGELSTRSTCAEALAEAQLPVGPTGGDPHTEVFGSHAMIELSTDTLFLARFSDGWRVTAAGCRPQGAGRPYDCAVKGS